MSELADASDGLGSADRGEFVSELTDTAAEPTPLASAGEDVA